MQKLKKILNPLDIPSEYQDDILSMIDNDNLSLLNEDDIIEALHEKGSMKFLAFDTFDKKIKAELIKAQAIIIIFEVLDDKVSSEHKEIIEFIYEIADDATVKFDFRIVTELTPKPIKLLLTGCIY